MTIFRVKIYDNNNNMTSYKIIAHSMLSANSFVYDIHNGEIIRVETETLTRDFDTIDKIICIDTADDIAEKMFENDFYPACRGKEYKNMKARFDRAIKKAGITAEEYWFWQDFFFEENEIAEPIWLAE